MAWRALSLLLLLASPSFAMPLPVDLAGFGDSLTSLTHDDGSYLTLLEDRGYIVSGADADFGVPANRTHGVLSRLDDWINGEGAWLPEGPQTADLVILLTGTPDTYHADYDLVETVGNVEAMIGLLVSASIPMILVAPPPVLDPCDDPATLTCAEIDTRLSEIADQLALLASDYADDGAQFLDLYAAFEADPRFGLIADGGSGQHPGPNSLYLDDGTHLRLETGDTLLANLLGPMIPEPSTALLLGSGLLVLAHRRRSPRRQA